MKPAFWTVSLLLLALGGWHLRETAVLKHQLTQVQQHNQALEKGNQQLKKQLQDTRAQVQKLRTSDAAQFQRAMKILQAGQRDRALKTLRNFIQAHPGSRYRRSAETQVQNIQAQMQAEHQVRVRRLQARKRQQAEQARQAQLLKQGFEVVSVQTDWIRTREDLGAFVPRVRLVVKNIGKSSLSDLSFQAVFVLEATREQLGTAETRLDHPVAPGEVQEVFLVSGTGEVFPEPFDPGRLPRTTARISYQKGQQKALLQDQQVLQRVGR